jgi:hypothetical protein
MARYDDLNTSTLGYLTFISVILLTITVLLLQALTYNWIEWQEDSKLTKQSYKASDAMIEAQKASLTKYENVQVEVPIKLPPGAPKDPKAPTTEKQNRNYIPIERAEAILLEQLKNKSKSATPST